MRLFLGNNPVHRQHPFSGVAAGTEHLDLQTAVVNAARGEVPPQAKGGRSLFLIVKLSH